IEAETIALLLGRDPLVLATGGGAVLNAETRRRLSDAGPVLYLQADAATLHDRTAGDPNRPPLTDLPAAEEMAAVLAEREPLYREVATAVIDADADPQSVRDWALAQVVDDDV
ncbi:MAG: shikimate kinase, partial [Planctomycetota bacterium]